MIGVLIIVRAVVALLVVAFVGLAFLPHFAAERLTRLQIFLTEIIERRRSGDRGQQ